jgi:hypothetical protein
VVEKISSRGGITMGLKDGYLPPLTKFVDLYEELESDKYIEKMKREGFDVVLPNSNELFIDIDSFEQYKEFDSMLDVLDKNKVQFKVLKDEYSRSGLPRRHIVIKLERDLSPVERIAFQAALGSDRTRELLSLLRYFMKDKNPTLFVEKKQRRRK